MNASPSPARDTSLGKRYIFKLASNAASIPLFLLMESILPRALGPEYYGSYSFATALFVQFLSFLDMGTPVCFSTALAKRPQEFGLVAFYARIASAVLFFTLVIACFMLIPALGNSLFPDVPVWMIFLAAGWAYLSWVGRVIRTANDSLALTVSSEQVRMGVNIISAAALLLLFFSGLLSVGILFVHQYLSLGILSLGFCYTMRNEWPRTDWRLTKQQYAEYGAEFKKFAGPLFVMTLCCALAVSGERWLLQFFNGNIQQGYFSLAQKISTGCFLFVTAMTPLITRELAVAHGRNDPEYMAKVLDRYAPALYAVAAWFACFTSIEADAVVRLFGGDAFSNALLPVQIMVFYAVHQGYGQIAGAVFYATGETKRLRNLTFIGLVLGGGCAYIFMAPAAWGGLHLGATGLAFKMVGVQIISVNILLLACRRAIPFGLKRNLLHQFICPACLIGLAFLTKYLTEYAGIGGSKDVLRFFISGMLYTCLTVGVVMAFPFIAGLRRGEPVSLCRALLNKIRRA